MANYFTKVSFTLPLSAEQAAWALRVLDHAENWLAHDEDKDAPFDADIREAVLSFAGMAPPGVTADHCGDSPGIWVYDEDGAADPDSIAHWLQLIASRFGIEEPMAFEWSCDCSRPRIGAFGGGAAFIAGGHLEAIDTGGWIREQRKTHRRRKRAAELAATRKFREGDLDEEVHDIAAAIASDINNGGPQAQIEWLLANGWEPTVTDRGEQA